MTIILIEGDKTTLADVFVQLVRLGYKLKNMNNLGNFKKCIINAFNMHWEELDINLYLLSYFLHPSYGAYCNKTGQSENWYNDHN